MDRDLAELKDEDSEENIHAAGINIRHKEQPIRLYQRVTLAIEQVTQCLSAD